MMIGKNVVGVESSSSTMPVGANFGDSPQPATSEAWYRVGRDMHDRGDLLDALTPYYNALAFDYGSSSNGEGESLYTAMIFMDIGRIYHSMNSLLESIQAYTHALRITKQNLGDSSIYVAKIMGILANIFVERGHIPEAMQVYSNSMRIQEANNAGLDLGQFAAGDPLVLMAATPRDTHAPSA